MPLLDRIDSSSLIVKELDESTDLSSFCCSDNDTMGLNEFIHNEAFLYQKHKLGKTYLFFYSDRLVGFTTLCMSVLRIEPTFLPFRVSFKEFPALLIGRLAVDNQFRKKNVGRNILLWVVAFALEQSERVGCRFVSVLTKGEGVSFYEKCGLIPINRKKKKVILYRQLLVEDDPKALAANTLQ